MTHLAWLLVGLALISDGQRATTGGVVMSLSVLMFADYLIIGDWAPLPNYIVTFVLGLALTRQGPRLLARRVPSLAK